MSPEEFERIKQAEKAHLREIKRLQELARDAGRRGRLAGALGEIAGSLNAGDSVRGEMIDRLTTGAAQAEARMEVALEGQAEAERQASLAADAERIEQEAARDRARQTVAELKAALGVPSTEARPAAADPAAGKTLGRPDPNAPAGPSGDAPPPGKTFGR